MIIKQHCLFEGIQMTYINGQYGHRHVAYGQHPMDIARDQQVQLTGQLDVSSVTIG